MPTPPDPDPRILDIYKLAVEMSDRVSARRVTANAFFVTVQAAEIAALGFLTGRPNQPPDGLLVSLSAVGVLSALIWWLLLLRYRDLNKAKFNVIHEIEKQLPLKVFTDEWTLMDKTPGSTRRKRYTDLGSVERLVPPAFGIINIVIAVAVSKA